MTEAVRLIANGKAPKITQTEWGATYDPIWKKKELAKVDFGKDALTIHNFIRGNDKIPGAWAVVDGQKISLFGSKFVDCNKPENGRTYEVRKLEFHSIKTYLPLLWEQFNRLKVVSIKLLLINTGCT